MVKHLEAGQDKSIKVNASTHGDLFTASSNPCSLTLFYENQLLKFNIAQCKFFEM